MCEELTEELSDGKRFAEQLARHLDEMGAAKATIPVEVDGQKYEVVVSATPTPTVQEPPQQDDKDGVWFVSACSGLRYRDRNAAGSLSSIIVDGEEFRVGIRVTKRERPGIVIDDDDEPPQRVRRDLANP